ncbi:MAG TPA: AraC family transcriptional regulator [Symbiobacteriaceae bacterium]|nr:AraC family transcriptional regulator [Symbiobacteriaceae bacterium]
MLLHAREILDPEAEAHYACIRSMRDITDMHCHDFYEVFLLARGRLWHVINGVKMPLEAGDLVFIRPDDQHSYERSGDEEMQLINLAFTAATFDALVAYAGEPPGLRTAALPPAIRLTEAELPSVTSRLLEAGAAQAQGRQAFRGAVRALLADLLVRFFSGRQTEATPPAPDWFRQLTEAMVRTENFTAGLPRLYELSPASPEHLCRMIRKHLRRTPTDWINDLRLQYAADLLSQTEEEIVAVSLKAGFENLSHFYHLFRKRFQLSPARYRKAHRRVIIPKS